MAPRWRHLGRFTAATFTPVAEAQGIRLDLERPEQLPAVSVDPGRIAQVLHNLLSNALHHSPAGGVVTLSAEADGAEVVLAARDTGEGIAAEDLPHVFDRFYRADRSRSHQRGGAGLGLAIARSLVVAHGGSLTLIEQPALRGVPNTACTEAFAFLFQSLGRRVVGFASPPGAPGPFDVDAVQTALGACQIAGPALVDLYAWRWLYQNPDADAAALRDTVIRLAAEVWDRHYRAHFGPDRYHTLGAYQHMVAYPLYLPDYALGQIMAHQIRSHMRGRDLASETRRICAIGRITPDLWLRRAVGAGISPSALMDDAAAAVARMG